MCARYLLYTGGDDDWGFSRVCVRVGDCGDYTLCVNEQAFVLLSSGALVDAGPLYVAARRCPAVAEELRRRLGVEGAVSALASDELPRAVLSRVMAGVEGLEAVYAAAEELPRRVAACREWRETIMPPPMALREAAAVMGGDGPCACDRGVGVVVGERCIVLLR